MDLLRRACCAGAVIANTLASILFALYGVAGVMADWSRAEAYRSIAFGTLLASASLVIVAGIVVAWNGRPGRRGVWIAATVTAATAVAITLFLFAPPGLTGPVQSVVMSTVAATGAGCAMWCMFSARPVRARQEVRRCVNCAYDLAGLPAPTTCPECGAQSP